MVLLAIHWGQWLAFGIGLVALSIFALYCVVIEPRRQRDRMERQKWNFEAFLRELRTDRCSFTGESHYWKQLTPYYRRQLPGKILELLADPELDAYDLNEAIRSLRQSPLKEELTDTDIQPIALACIERDRRRIFLYDLAKTAWGEGKIPTEILLKLLENDTDKEDILQKEVRPDNEHEIATFIARRGEWEYLEDIFGEGNFPEGYVRICLDFFMQKDPEERPKEDILYCYALLKEWGNLLAFAKYANAPAEELLLLVREAPAEIRETLASQLAEEGLFWRLISLFNPNMDLDELEMPPPVVPPEPLLRTCLTRLRTDMANDETDDGLFERMAAECAMLLNDLEQCQEIADHCVGKKYPGIAGPLLYFIQRTRRDRLVATAPAS